MLLGAPTNSRERVWKEGGKGSEEEDQHKSLNEFCVPTGLCSARKPAGLSGQQDAAPGTTEEMSSFSVFGSTPLYVCVCVWFQGQSAVWVSLTESLFSLVSIDCKCFIILRIKRCNDLIQLFFLFIDIFFDYQVFICHLALSRLFVFTPINKPG